jgi:hypothetical protein
MKLTPNLKYAELELKHIQLELLHNRFEHLRSFIDQYYCYRIGHVKSTGRADWEAIVWKGTVSVAARKCALDRKRVVREHAVPMSVIRTQLALAASGRFITLTQIAAILKKYTVFATITKEEDSQLRQSGLSKAMPAEFSDPDHLLFGDLLARYKHLGIELEPSA